MICTAPHDWEITPDPIACAGEDNMLAMTMAKAPVIATELARFGAVLVFCLRFNTTGRQPLVLKLYEPVITKMDLTLKTGPVDHNPLV